MYKLIDRICLIEINFPTLEEVTATRDLLIKQDLERTGNDTSQFYIIKEEVE